MGMMYSVGPKAVTWNHFNYRGSLYIPCRYFKEQGVQRRHFNIKEAFPAYQQSNYRKIGDLIALLVNFEL